MSFGSFNRFGGLFIPMTFIRSECPKLTAGKWVIESTYAENGGFFKEDIEFNDYESAKAVVNALCESIGIPGQKMH